MKIRQTGFAEINETRIFVFFVVRYPKNENKVRKKFRRPNPLPCTLSKTSGDAPAAGDDFFPDSGDRDLSIGEVSAPMDATNKSYGRFKLSFFYILSWSLPIWKKVCQHIALVDPRGVGGGEIFPQP